MIVKWGSPSKFHGDPDFLLAGERQERSLVRLWSWKGMTEAPGAETGTAPLAPGDDCAFAVGHGGRRKISRAATASVTDVELPTREVERPRLPPSAREEDNDSLLKHAGVPEGKVFEL